MFNNLPMLDYIYSTLWKKLSGEETLELFSELIKNGQAWTLQGCYGRTAQNLIDRGLISKKGIIAWELYQELVVN